MYKGVDTNEKNAPKECDICHYWYFLGKIFNFQQFVFNGYHDLLLMSVILNNIAFFNIWSVEYCCIVNEIDQSEAINLLQNADLTIKRRIL